MSYIKKYENPNDERIAQTIRDGVNTCVCSHSQLIPPNKDSDICTYCGRTIKNTSKAHFRYAMFKMIKKEK